MGMGIAIRIHSEQSCPIMVSIQDFFDFVFLKMYSLLTLVSIPISHPAMFTPASQTALACATKADTKIERSITSWTENEEVR
jgi:hypothetical protein